MKAASPSLKSSALVGPSPTLALRSDRAVGAHLLDVTPAEAELAQDRRGVLPKRRHRVQPPLPVVRLGRRQQAGHRADRRAELTPPAALRQLRMG